MRQRGQLNCFNFEPFTKGPLDSRTLVDTVEHLYDEEYWNWGDSPNSFYDGFVALVVNGKKPGLYVLTDSENPYEADSWQKLDGVTGGDVYWLKNTIDEDEDDDSNEGEDEGEDDPEFVTNLQISITYLDLVALRNSSNLIPGLKYRIIDYDCTTRQLYTDSAHHKFDIIVKASSNSQLSEIARATAHVFSDEDSQEETEYFLNNNLEAWELKYALDNDGSLYDWADSDSGKGVIYWMKDEFENEAPYDFKNILIAKDSSNNYPHIDPFNTSDISLFNLSNYYYTFDNDGGDGSLTENVRNNKIQSSHYNKYIIPFIGFVGSSFNDNIINNNCYCIIINNNTINNIIEHGSNNIIISNNSINNTIKYNCSYIKLTTSFEGNIKNIVICPNKSGTYNNIKEISIPETDLNSSDIIVYGHVIFRE